MHWLHLFKFAANCGTNTGFFPGLYDGLNCDAAGNIHLGSLQDIWVVVGNLVRILLMLAGSLAVVFIIVGGLWYITSYGDPARLKQAKEILNYAVAGLIICLVAFSVVTFVAGRF